MKIASYKDIDDAIEKTADKFQAYFLDYWNDFLTIEGYARYYSIPMDEANQRINIGRKIHNARTKK